MALTLTQHSVTGSKCTDSLTTHSPNTVSLWPNAQTPSSHAHPTQHHKEQKHRRPHRMLTQHGVAMTKCADALPIRSANTASPGANVKMPSSRSYPTRHHREQMHRRPHCTLTEAPLSEEFVILSLPERDWNWHLEMADRIKKLIKHMKTAFPLFSAIMTFPNFIISRLDENREDPCSDSLEGTCDTLSSLTSLAKPFYCVSSWRITTISRC